MHNPCTENLKQDFPGVQWLRLHTPNTGVTVSIPGLGRFHMLHVMVKKKERKREN